MEREGEDVKDIESLDIIIPTFNNPRLLGECISSIACLRFSYPVRILVVNNGHPNSLGFIPEYPFVEVIQTGGKNLGWEGGLKEGLKHSKSEFVMFLNDDTYIPASSKDWINTLVSTFENKDVAAVGPTTNVVMGAQNIWKTSPHISIETTYLIGFCMLLKRKFLDEVGGVDFNLPGGDDLDLSIRFRLAGYKLVCRRDVFVYHHGFVTGRALYGDENKANGWNSRKMIERTNMALIKKHGFKNWFLCISGLDHAGLQKGKDDEGDRVRESVIGEKILDLGCANNKTVPNAIGIDIVKKGNQIKNLNAISEADVQGNVEEPLPFDDGSQDTVIARHILEHCVDLVETMKRWVRVLKHGGRLIVAVPDERQKPSIPLNPEHVHAFTPQSLSNIGELIGLNKIDCKDTSSMSFVMTFEKNGKQ